MYISGKVRIRFINLTIQLTLVNVNINSELY